MGFSKGETDGILSANSVDSVLRKLFLGKGFRKTSADFCFCILFARRRGLGRNPRGFSEIFCWELGLELGFVKLVKKC